MLSGKQDFHSSFGKKGITVQVVQRGICKCVMRIWKFSQKSFLGTGYVFTLYLRPVLAMH